jgi:hypothetical protein
MDEARARRLTLIACILGSSIVFVDPTVVNLALPSLRACLRQSAEGYRRGVRQRARTS